MKNTRQIKNDFNRLAEELGCAARLSGNAKKPKFEMFTGQITSDGFEVVIGIDANKFGQLISKYPQLHD
jgi:predicted ribosome quality control (RQC) complex YloA/Tae2 family protein